MFAIRSHVNCNMIYVGGGRLGNGGLLGGGRLGNGGLLGGGVYGNDAVVELDTDLA